MPVFISYASYDNTSDDPEKRWLDRLLQFLKPMELDSRITSWSDTDLTPGSQWKQEIQDAIGRAKVAILLVSPAFLASKFIRTEELPRLLSNSNSDYSSLSGDEEQEGMLILPILIRPCLIDKIEIEVHDGPSEVRHTTLSEFQYVPKGSAMNGLSEYQQDKELEYISRKILDALDLVSTPNIESVDDPDSILLGNQLVSFLSTYNSWWFNALRIRNWGSKQRNFKLFRDFTVTQIEAKLKALNKDDMIDSKDGKRSRVYKAY